LNHRTAPVSLREKLYLSKDDIEEAIKRLKAGDVVGEAVIVSTCNRTELYLVGWDGDRCLAAGEEFLRGMMEGDLEGEGGRYLYSYTDPEAVSHLFRVASGLDSMMLGEPQILGQVKDAYRWSFEISGTGPVLNRLFNHAFRTAKKVRNQTGLGTGAVSVPSVTIELALKILGRLTGRKALLLGIGKIGEQVARGLKDRGIGGIFISNRDYAKAVDLSKALGGVPVPFAERMQYLREVDLVVSAVSSDRPVLTREMFRDCLRIRRNAPLVVIDLGVPRNVQEAARQLENLFLFDIDSLRGLADYNRERRKEEVARAEPIIARETGNFMNWFNGLAMMPTIVGLKRKLEAIGEAEIRRVENRFTAEDREKLRSFTAGLLKKILDHPFKVLHESAGSPAEADFVKAVKRLFKLDEDG